MRDSLFINGFNNLLTIVAKWLKQAAHIGVVTKCLKMPILHESNADSEYNKDLPNSKLTVYTGNCISYVIARFKTFKK